MREITVFKPVVWTVALAVMLTGLAWTQEDAPRPRRTPDVVFVPTPHEAVEVMLRLADVKKDDVVYDLGCGDGRIVVAAAKKVGCKAWGYDIDPQRVKESKENVKKNKVEDLVAIEEKDIFELDLSKASVVTLYLLPTLNVKLIPQLDKMKPGSRIVSHDFDMAGVTPDVEATVNMKNGQTRKVYLWTTPLRKTGDRGRTHRPVFNVDDIEVDLEN